MVKLLKAEFKYHLNTIGTASGIYLFIAIVVFSKEWRSPEQDGIGMLSIALTFTFLISMLRLLIITKEKKDRFMVLLPLSNYAIGLCRLLVGIIFWIGLLVIFYTLLFIFQNDDFRIWLIRYSIFLTGLWLIINAFPILHRDLNYYFESNYQKIMVGIIYVMIFIIGLFVFSSAALLRYFPSLPVDFFLSIREMLTNDPTLFNAIQYLIFGIILTILNAFIFARRKAYID